MVIGHEMFDLFFVKWQHVLHVFRKLGSSGLARSFIGAIKDNKVNKDPSVSYFGATRSTWREEESRNRSSKELANEWKSSKN